MSNSVPSPPTTEEGDIELVLTKDKCKFDGQLEVTPCPSSWNLDFNQSNSRVISTFPFLGTFINFACIAYKNPSKEETYLGRLLRSLGLRDAHSDEAKAAAEPTGIPHGFEFLVEATNTSLGNGYYGVAYINRVKRQVILSHKGTELSNVGALQTDAKSICGCSYSPQVSSAISFAHLVAQFAQRTNCQLFFTGHSLGAWLAQITCFSTKYLTLNESSHFVRKSSDLWDDLHPYTVVFDSPGALEFLQRMKDDLFPRNDPQSQMEVNVACLPVEVFQFHTNSVNILNTQIGSVYIVDLEKAEVQYTYVWKRKVFGKIFKVHKPITFKTHGADPVRDLISNNGTKTEDDVLRSHVIDWRVDKWDDFLHKWKIEGRSVSVDLHRFPAYFLTTQELELLKKQSEKGVDGCYEGLSSEDEMIANRLVECSRRSGIFQEGSLQLGTDRREVIPFVRHFLHTLKNEVIWWNPRKPRLPQKYIERRVARTHLFKANETFSASDSYKTRSLIEAFLTPNQNPQSYSSSSSSDDDDFETATKQSKLVLLVDTPGMGKSSEVTNLDQTLRKHIPHNRLIIRVNLNEVQTTLKALSPSECASNVLLKLAHFLPPKSLQTPLVRVFLLLDGLDEVCPKHQATMLNLLRILTSRNEPTIQCNLRVLVTTRPHLRDAVQSEFQLESWSLLPLTTDEQDEYMKSVLGVSSEQSTKIRRKLHSSVEGLLRNPLMLFMFVDIIKSGANVPTGNKLNTFELYTRYVEAKHKLQLVEKEGMREEDNFTEMRLEGLLERSLPHYYRVALTQLFHTKHRRKFILSEWEGSVTVAQDEPSEVTRKELLSIGLLVENRDSRRVFKHLSFVEFFHARLLTLEESAPQAVRDALFGNIYSGPHVLYNVVDLLLRASMSKTPPMLTPPTWTPPPSLFNLYPIGS